MSSEKGSEKGNEKALLHALKRARDWVSEMAHSQHEPRCERMMEQADEPCRCMVGLAQTDLWYVDAAIRQAERPAERVTSEVQDEVNSARPPRSGEVLPPDVDRGGSGLDRHGCGG